MPKKSQGVTILSKSGWASVNPLIAKIFTRCWNFGQFVEFKTMSLNLSPNCFSCDYVDAIQLHLDQYYWWYILASPYPFYFHNGSSYLHFHLRNGHKQYPLCYHLLVHKSFRKIQFWYNRSNQWFEHLRDGNKCSNKQRNNNISLVHGKVHYIC